MPPWAQLIAVLAAVAIASAFLTVRVLQRRVRRCAGCETPCAGEGEGACASGGVRPPGLRVLQPRGDHESSRRAVV
ncbi:MAG: hypothetical protein KC636_06410 [Myxococcales bacterium]|nr:hypothetical protein [Myxococcales bacterium]